MWNPVWAIIFFPKQKKVKAKQNLKKCYFYLLRFMISVVSKWTILSLHSRALNHSRTKSVPSQSRTVGLPNCLSWCRAPLGHTERFYCVWSLTSVVTVTLGLLRYGKGSKIYVQIRVILQLAKINLNFITRVKVIQHSKCTPPPL